MNRRIATGVLNGSNKQVSDDRRSVNTRENLEAVINFANSIIAIRELEIVTVRPEAFYLSKGGEAYRAIGRIRPDDFVEA